MVSSRWLMLTSLGVLSACSSENAPEQQEEVSETPPPAGVTAGEEDATFATADYTLEPGQEKFLCFATSTAEELVIEGYSHVGRPTVHHVIFSRTTAPEPDGYSECDTLFRVTWEPLYLAGAGSSSLEFPSGFAHTLPPGAQLVAQMHLLNTSSERVTDSLAIKMRRSKADAPRSVGSYAFGSFGVNLPPAQTSTVEGTCELKQDVRLLAAFPHMHLLGKGLTFDVARGPTGPFERVFTRDPYDFDDQHLEPLDLELAVGDRTRVRCEYDNPHDQVITFGESTMSEMCFFVGFATDRERIGGCFQAPSTGTEPQASVTPQ